MGSMIPRMTDCRMHPALLLIWLPYGNGGCGAGPHCCLNSTSPHNQPDILLLTFMWLPFFIQGTLPSALFLLGSLSSLDLSGNWLSGSLPSTLG